MDTTSGKRMREMARQELKAGYSPTLRDQMKLNLKRQAGASAVEFAILLPFLVLLVSGVIEFGLLFYNQQVLTNATREGARLAITGLHCADRKSDAEIEAKVTGYCAGRLITFGTGSTSPTANVSPSPADCTPGGSGLTVGDNVTVSAEYTYTFLLPSVLGLGSTKVLNAQTVMKMESEP